MGFPNQILKLDPICRMGFLLPFLLLGILVLGSPEVGYGETGRVVYVLIEAEQFEAESCLDCWDKANRPEDYSPPFWCLKNEAEVAVKEGNNFLVMKHKLKKIEVERKQFRYYSTMTDVLKLDKVDFWLCLPVRLSRTQEFRNTFDSVEVRIPYGDYERVYLRKQKSVRLSGGVKIFKDGQSVFQVREVLLLPERRSVKIICYADTEADRESRVVSTANVISKTKLNRVVLENLSRAARENKITIDGRLQKGGIKSTHWDSLAHVLSYPDGGIELKLRKGQELLGLRIRVYGEYPPEFLFPPGSGRQSGSTTIFRYDIKKRQVLYQEELGSPPDREKAGSVVEWKKIEIKLTGLSAEESRKPLFIEGLSENGKLEFTQKLGFLPRSEMLILSQENFQKIKDLNVSKLRIRLEGKEQKLVFDLTEAEGLYQFTRSQFIGRSPKQVPPKPVQGLAGTADLQLPSSIVITLGNLRPQVRSSVVVITGQSEDGHWDTVKYSSDLASNSMVLRSTEIRKIRDQGISRLRIRFATDKYEDVIFDLRPGVDYYFFDMDQFLKVAKDARADISSLRLPAWIHIEPLNLTSAGKRDRIVVEGESEDGRWVEIRSVSRLPADGKISLRSMFLNKIKANGISRLRLRVLGDDYDDVEFALVSGQVNYRLDMRHYYRKSAPEVREDVAGLQLSSAIQIVPKQLSFLGMIGRFVVEGQTEDGRWVEIRSVSGLPGDGRISLGSPQVERIRSSKMSRLRVRALGDDYKPVELSLVSDKVSYEFDMRQYYQERVQAVDEKVLHPKPPHRIEVMPLNLTPAGRNGHIAIEGQSGDGRWVEIRSVSRLPTDGRVSLGPFQFEKIPSYKMSRLRIRVLGDDYEPVDFSLVPGQREYQLDMRQYLKRAPEVQESVAVLRLSKRIQIAPEHLSPSGEHGRIAVEGKVKDATWETLREVPHLPADGRITLGPRFLHRIGEAAMSRLRVWFDGDAYGPVVFDLESDRISYRFDMRDFLLNRSPYSGRDTPVIAPPPGKGSPQPGQVQLELRNLPERVDLDQIVVDGSSDGQMWVEERIEDIQFDAQHRAVRISLTPSASRVRIVFLDGKYSNIQIRLQKGKARYPISIDSHLGQEK